ncbi:MAG: polymerase subunit sigma-70 [Chryseobacterium sp.]|nr:polymerase subunit sigma-70 [Chryseobacterium sp.]
MGNFAVPIMNPTDYKLLKEIKSGNRPAFMTFYDRHWNTFYSFIFARTKSKDITEEILQKLWVRILEDADFVQTDEQQNAKNYLLRFLHFRIVDQYKSKEQTLVNVENLDDETFELTDSEYFEILEENEIGELFEMINQIVSQLSSTEQKVYDLRIRKNMSVNETAEALGLSNKTVSNNLSKSITEIRKQLSPKYKSSKKLISALIWLEIMANMS